MEAQIYHDVYVGYTFAEHSSNRTARSKAWSGLSLQMGAKNVFDTKPAFQASNVRTFSSEVVDLRMGAWYVSLRKRF